MNSVAKPSIDTHSTWQASLALGLERTERGTVLRRCRHQGPLYVQKPFYPEGRELAHLYLLHPPGGMVSGDDLRISVHTAQQARALVTTPGAGRVYRARPDRRLQQQSVVLNLAEDSSLEWLPLENIIYPDANTALNLDIHLAPGASIISWEITCFGLPARGESFDCGEVSQTVQLFQQGRLKLRERLRLTPGSEASGHPDLMQSRAGLNGCSVNGLLLAGPFTDTEAQEPLLAQLRELCDGSSALAAVTLNDQFLQVRYLGECSEAARLLFTRCWRQIRPQLLDRSPCEPRIWAT